jgi:flagellin FlaB
MEIPKVNKKADSEKSRFSIELPQLFDTDSERGQVGIGTLIVFIAMVLVAAIAAGVLINTAGFLQTQAEDTGTESTEQVADNLNVITTTGNVSGADKINELRIGVQPAAGSDQINLAKLTLQYVSEDEFANIVVANDTNGNTASGDTDPDNLRVGSDSLGWTPDSGDERFNVSVVTAEQPGDIVMTDSADRYEVVIPLNSSAEPGVSGQTDFNGDLKSLDEGEDVQITITTEVGAQTVAFMQIPDSLAGSDAGSSVNI